ncbi:MAG: patatin-like phospholipase family protein [Clostridium sp.]|uniref:patatin-like phospholipase family protein n=1 Tax=Clostridium sp. TaxID=1506 RepID=UPI00306F41B0
MKIGLVLSGGGGKGAYEIGVWKAIKELGIDRYIKAISGTSIGAFNAALFAQNDFEEAERLWEEVTLEKMMPINSRELIKKGITLAVGSRTMAFAKKYMASKLEHGDVPRDGATDIINRYINVKKIRASGINCYVSCTEMPEFTAKYFKLNDYEDDIVKSILMATACVPMIYESEAIYDKTYLDGGLTDNTPIKPVYEDGCDIIIAVLLDKLGTVNRQDFPNAKIIEIIPSDMETKILEGLLNLDDEAKTKRIQRGYEDTKNLLEPIFEIARYQYKEQLKQESIQKEVQRKENENENEKANENENWWRKKKREIRDRIFNKKR